MIVIRDWEFERLPNGWVRVSLGLVKGKTGLFLAEQHFSPKEWDQLVAEMGESWKPAPLAPT